MCGKKRPREEGSTPTSTGISAASRPSSVVVYSLVVVPPELDFPGPSTALPLDPLLSTGGDATPGPSTRRITALESMPEGVLAG